MTKRRFLDQDPGGEPPRRPAWAVLPVPYERTVSYGRGTSKAPAAILRASVEAELFDEEAMCPYNLDVQTLPAVACRGRAPEAVFASIRRAAAGAFASGRRLMALGGEHSISLPLVEAARAAHTGLSVLHLDAHLDLRSSFRGEFYSHACVFRRIMELGVPAIHAGIRSLCREEYNLVRRRGLKVFWATDIASACNLRWIDAILRQLARKVYVSIDVDAFDPSVMPGTGTPEPGGLQWTPVLHLLRRVARERQVVGADIVEAVPLPGTPVCEYLSAKLALKLMSYCTERKHRGKL